MENRNFNVINPEKGIPFVHAFIGTPLEEEAEK